MVRLKNRYLLVDILYPDPKTWPTTPTTKPHNPQLAIHSPTSDALTQGFLAKMIRESVAELYGDYGIGKLGGASAGGITIKYLSPATSTAIVRCPRASFRLVWSALTYMSGVPEPANGPKRAGTGRERGCVFRVIRVSGTMRKAEEEAIRRARREIVRVKDAEERGFLGGGVMDESEDEGMDD
ncbi:Ribonuclease P/MRP protein subunit [Penicillium crustosum]|uniref:Ribonuclease P/MRP protein subunit n=1 Tax=Penicillium crustosum TaxID=36656 RepID=UPI00239BBC44|nr:Ribonuclease P/MRP protein subunit [Penicillium crustosum]KAJ5418345.1 Ribonuclease P/MRP protein subunit [Penicillium crustosum]